MNHTIPRKQSASVCFSGRTIKIKEDEKIPLFNLLRRTEHYPN